MRQDRTSNLIRAAQGAARQRIREDRKGAPPDVAEIVEAIEQGIFDPTFSVAAAKRACGATQTEVLHFHQHFATTMQAYIMDLLLRTAKELVDDCRVDLGAVPGGLGFNDDGVRFSRWFGRWTGKTPAKRREEVSEEPDFETWTRAAVGALRAQEAEDLARACDGDDTEGKAT